MIGMAYLLLLDIGCGTNKKQGYIGIDRVKLPGVDVVCDIEEGLPFKDNTVDGIRVIQVLEHVRDLIFVLEEFWRVCKEFIRPTKKKFWAYIWETLKDKFANRFPDIYENTWLKIFSARHLEVRLVVKKWD